MDEHELIEQRYGFAIPATYRFNSWEFAVDGGFVPFAITGSHEPYCYLKRLRNRE